jgi:diguanylate cyclase
MSARIAEVHDAIDTALATANAFSGRLQEVDAGLRDEAASPEALRALAAQLLTQTRQMQQHNAQLVQRLEGSRSDIVGLQRDLDEVRRESLLDPLTKIYNRKCFDDGLLRAISDANLGGGPLCLLLVDIDHFKRFNDTYGHQTGDQVLRLVAMTLKSNIKGRDLVARYGGEEFAAILPATDLEGALILAENIRKAIQSKELLKRSTNEKLGRITASFGIALYREGESPSALIERADRCLYAAKREGRNCVFAETQLSDDNGTAAA